MTPATMDACVRLLGDIDYLRLGFGRVLEIGARDINGSLRPTIEPHASEYIGIDIVDGPGVDRIMSVRDAVGIFGHQAFDLIVCTETLEHVEHWHGAVWGMKALTKVGGHILLTTRMLGFPLHDSWGPDWWRFTEDDIEDAFIDFDGTILADYIDMGVYILQRRVSGERPMMPAFAVGRI